MTLIKSLLASPPSVPHCRIEALRTRCECVKCSPLVEFFHIIASWVERLALHEHTLALARVPVELPHYISPTCTAT